jgi:DNA-binding SARP family transcriptional activator
VLRIRALGGLSVEQDGGPVAGAAAQPRRLAILAILARAGQRGASRERLLAMLWPDANEEASRNTLNHALYTLRRDLGSPDAIAGVRELRLEPSIIDSDVNQFEELSAEGNLEAAVAQYGGPFLDGFRLPGSPEFDRWVESERDALAQRHADALDKLARANAARGDQVAAANWWRRLAALDPLNARVTIELMRALAAAGDRAGALQHARIYEALLEEQLDIAPDKAVVEFARKLREEPASVPPPKPNVVAAQARLPDPVPATAAAAPTAAPASEPVAVPAQVVATGSTTPWWKRRANLVRAAIVAGAAVAAVVATQRARTAQTSPVVAIGHIVDYRSGANEDVTAPLADMLSTNLARATSLRVIGSARMLEMLTRASTDRDTSAIYLRAARLAGATDVIEGSVVALPDGGYRLDLRRVTLADGTIRDAQTVRGSDLFALADSGSAKLLAAFGQAPVHGSISDVTTRSLAAYRQYARGLKRFQAGDVDGALQFFESALGEDSTFAMAAYWASISIGLDWRSPDRRRMMAHLDRAVRLSSAVSERERLVIRTWWARATSSPSLRATAETLSVRFPEELDGHVQAGAAAILAGDFLRATIPLERAIALDSNVLATGVVRCGGCEAMDLLIRAWVAADSMAAAERVARRAMRIWPKNVIAFALMAEVLDYQGRFAEAEAVIDSASTLGGESTVSMRARHWVRSGRFDRLDPRLAEHVASTGPQGRLLFWSTMSLRNQGRFDSALVVARRVRAAGAEPADVRGAAPLTASIEAQVLFEAGKYAASAALFDSIGAWRLQAMPDGSYATSRLWFLTQEAAARAALGDAPALAALRDSVESLGLRTYSERDRRLHHHVRGLEALMRKDVAGAISHFEQAMYSTTIGYNRTNYELATAYLQQNRAREANALLRPAARGVVLEGANLHLTLAEIHAVMAQAFTALGQADSARAHSTWARPSR